MLTSHKGNINFSSLDDLISDAIENKIFPSASILVANSTETLYTKQFGTFTYDSDQPVKEDSMYDIASVTKVVATLSAVMRLYEDKKINLMDPVIKYIPEFDNNNKQDILIKHLLLHNSGIKPFAPFYTYLKTGKEVLNEIYNLPKEYETGTKTVYSCLGFILLAEIFRRITGKPLDVFCKEELFKPLGMNNTMHNPPESIRDQIVPTEIDKKWRNKLIQGIVHDETSDLLGGASGNAGLFSTAKDLVKYMQMNLNKGVYVDSNGEKQRMFNEETIELFTKCDEDCSFENTRALGWETKPIVANVNRGPPCSDLFSKNCFGHTGFTGTSVWADKKKGLIVILLTNRVNPTREQSQEAMLDFRPVFHRKVCEILGYPQ